MYSLFSCHWFFLVAIDQNSQNKIILCFVHPIFRFWFLVTFGDEVTKIFCNLCLHFASKDGQEGKKQKENHATKVTKIPKTKRWKYGMNKTLMSLQPMKKKFKLHTIPCKNYVLKNKSIFIRVGSDKETVCLMKNNLYFHWK